MENNKVEVKSRNGVIIFLIVLVLIFATAFVTTSVYILGYKQGIKSGEEDKSKDTSVQTQDDKTATTYEIKTERKHLGDEGDCLIINAVDKQGNTKWTYTTDSVLQGQCDNLEYVKSSSYNKLVYIIVNTHLVALENQTGKVAWKAQIADSYWEIGHNYVDEKGTVYLNNGFRPEIKIVDNTGKVVKTITGFSEAGGAGYFVSEFTEENGSLKMTFIDSHDVMTDTSKSAVLTINLTDYSFNKTVQ
jgi:hypothetical protein